MTGQSSPAHGGSVVERWTCPGLPAPERVPCTQGQGRALSFKMKNFPWEIAAAHSLLFHERRFSGGQWLFCDVSVKEFPSSWW